MEFISVRLIVVFGMLPIVCEAITEIIGASELFAPLREFITRKEILFFKGLVECKYCMSIWVSVGLVFGYFVACGSSTDIGLMELFFFFVLVILVHRLSNIYHLVFDAINNYKLFRWAITVTPMEE